MARKLTKLRIDEISSVDKAAGEGTRVVLMKRHDGTPQQSNWERFCRREALRQRFEGIDFSKLNARPPDDPDDDDILTDDDEPDTAALPPKLQQAIAALILAHPEFDAASAARYLMNTQHGRALVEHLSKRKDQPMDRATELRDIAKQYGVVAIAKHIIDEGSAHGISEHELTGLIDIEAQKTRKAGERPASCFARYFQSDEALPLRKAIQIAKNSPAPVPVEPVQPATATVAAADSTKAYQQLVDKANVLRAASPQLSEAQAFAKAFSDNPELAAKAHQRPSATTSYAYPR